MTERQRLGGTGERLAERLLNDRGYRVVERNYRSRWGEIDLIAWSGEVLVFVEVRLRRGSTHGTAADSLVPAKAQRLVRTAQTYLERYGDAIPDWRIDFVAIDLAASGRVERLEVFENAVGDPGW
ncbi:MAG: YraN family protein [Chloroflexi bacterium]|nr:YraN family protein [Chloroflexota bacterium]